MKTFRVSVAGGIDAVTDLAMSDGKHVLYMENLDLRSGKAIPYHVPEVNPNITVPYGSVQVFAYRGRLIFNVPGRRSYATEFLDNRERIYWTQYGGYPQKMIAGTTVSLGIQRPASPTVGVGTALAPVSLTLTLSEGGGSLAAGQTLSFRLAYHTARGVMPACGAVVTTIPSGSKGDYMITLTWDNPEVMIPASEIWVFVGTGTGDEVFVVALGAKSTSFEYTENLGRGSEAASDYDQGASYQYCVTYLRNVNGVEDESGPSTPTPGYQSTLARQVNFDPWSEGILASVNTVTWGSEQPAYSTLTATSIPGNGPSASPLTVTSIVKDTESGKTICTFSGPHSFHDGERIFIVGCSPDPFLNPDVTVVADTTARNAIVDSSRVIGMLVQTSIDSKVYQLQGGIADSDWVNVTGTYFADLPVKIKVADSSVAGVTMFNQVELWVGDDFTPPGSGLSGVTAFRVASVGLSSIDYNPQSGVLDIYTTTPHTFGDEKVLFANFTDASWNTTDGIEVMGDPNNSLRLFVENMTLPSDASSGISTQTVSKILTEIVYSLGSGSLSYSSTGETQYGTSTPVVYATVTASSVSGLTGPQGTGADDKITYTNASEETGLCPVLNDVLYLTLADDTQVPARVVGVLEKGVLLNQNITSTISAIKFVPHNDYITKRKLYRAGGTTAFELVEELDLEKIAYLDGIPDAGLGEVLPTLYTQDGVSVDYEPAPFGLVGLTQHYAMGFAWDPSSNQLRWTPENHFDAWPSEFYQGFDYRILGLKSFNHALCVFCEDGVYRMDGPTSTQLVRNKTKAAGCRAGGSVQIVNNTIIYLGGQGLMEFNGQESRCLTDLKIPSEFWLGTSRYLGNSTPGQYLVPFTQNAALERLVGTDQTTVTPRYLMPYQINPNHYMDAERALRSFVLYGKYYLYWGADFSAYAAQTMVCVDFSSQGNPISVIGVKPVDVYVDELNQVHMVLSGIQTPTFPANYGWLGGAALGLVALGGTTTNGSSSYIPLTTSDLE